MTTTQQPAALPFAALMQWCISHRAEIVARAKADDVPAAALVEAFNTYHRKHEADDNSVDYESKLRQAVEAYERGAE